MLYIAERAQLGVDMGIEQITVNTVKRHNHEPEHLARNPFGSLPVLELDDGSYIVESLAVIEYLEDKFPEETLLTGTAEQKGLARDVERIVDIRVAGPMGGYGHATNSPLGLPPDPEKAEQLLKALQKPLDYLENLLSDGRPLFLGERVSIADCTMQASLQFMRFVEVNLIGDRPLLRAWNERYRARPAAQAVLKW
jgi:glutathione S-transferase